MLGLPRPVRPRRARAAGDGNLIVRGDKALRSLSVPDANGNPPSVDDVFITPYGNPARIIGFDFSTASKRLMHIPATDIENAEYPGMGSLLNNDRFDTQRLGCDPYMDGLL